MHTQSVREPLAVVLIMIIVYVQLVILNYNLANFGFDSTFYRAQLSSCSSVFQATFDTIGSMELVDQKFENQKKIKLKVVKSFQKI